MKKNILDASLMTAIKTPYKSGGEIDLSCFDELVKEQIRHGVDGLIVCGTTGEGHLMDWEEHLMLIAHCVNDFGDKMIIVGNTGSNNTLLLYPHSIAGRAASDQPPTAVRIPTSHGGTFQNTSKV